MKITLCGSTRFKLQFDAINRYLTTRGHVVYSCAFFGNTERVEPHPEEKLMLDAVHMAKIMNSDAILVLNIGGYVGESTRREMYLAKVLDRPVLLLEPQQDKRFPWALPPSAHVLGTILP